MTQQDVRRAIRSLATRREFVTAVSIGVGSLGLIGKTAGAAAEEISRTQESIHQEVWLRAAPARVYSALTDSEQFQKLTLLSAAVKSGMAKPDMVAKISPDVGGAFVLFGGIITGLTIELVPNERIVQAWRAADWAPGVYSIVRFELRAKGQETTLLFDHTGFPTGAAEELAAGWKGNYWEPLSKLLG
jgi:uncharacterized protein YndB with AHSA1/START domain